MRGIKRCAVLKAIALGSCLLASPSWAANCFVATAANGGNDANGGTGWGDAKLTPAAAATVAINDGDNIYVKEGTYECNQLTLSAGVSIYGGYLNASSGTDLSQRNVASNPTILSGEVAGVPTNRICLVNVTTATVTPTYDGLTFYHGLHSTVTGTVAAGAAMYISGITGLNVNNCRFLENTARVTATATATDYARGGAIYMDAGTAYNFPITFTNCEFTSNVAYTIANANNDVPQGGCVYSLRTGAPKVTFTGCLFQGNQAIATRNATAVPTATGGALYVSSGSAGNHVIDRCRFISNSAQSLLNGVPGSGAPTAGAIFYTGGGNADMVIQNCFFYDNQLLGATPTIGTAIASTNGTVKPEFIISHCTFDANGTTAQYVIYTMGNATTNTITNCIFSNNDYSTVTNGGTAACVNDLHYTLYYNVNRLAWTFNNGVAYDNDPRTGNPLYASAGSYVIQDGSAAVDQAPSAGLSPDVDILGQARPVNNTGVSDNGGPYDIGCFENQTVPVTLSGFAIQ